MIGKLSFAAKVIKPGRLFLRRLIDLSASFSSPSHHIYLNLEARADISWWSKFISQWNGVSIIQEPTVFASDIVLSTDAALHSGFGVVFGPRWAFGPWPPQFSHWEIGPKEFLAIFVAISLWKDRLRNKQVVLYTDSLSSTQVWISGVSKDPSYMRVLRPLFFLCAVNNINLLLHHVDDHLNILADALSRFQLTKFRELHPFADADPTPVPNNLWIL